MSADPGIVIVGASLAGAKAAQALRLDHGYDRPITLVGDEPHLPYERPALSKGYLLGTTETRELDVLEPRFYSDQDITLALGAPATVLDLDARRVRTAGAAEFAFSRVLIATGSRAGNLQVPGAGLVGVHYLRDRDDSEHLGEALRAADHVVIVGAGWLGSELAAASHALGNRTTVIDPLPTPLYTVLGDEIGGLFARRHRDHGVDLLTGDGVEAVLGTHAVEAVRTIKGRRIPADLVIVGVGAVPNTELAEAAGLRVDGGILADRHLRTSHPAAVAAGDVARHQHPRYLNPVRIEHWDNAVVHGTAAAATLLDKPVTIDHVPYFFSTQYGSTLEYVGYPTRWDRVVTRGEPDAPGFTAFWLDGATPVAAMTIDNWGAADHLRALVAAAHPADPRRLADAGTPLPDLLPSAPSRAL
ncbi:NAD(P)/FAD-dependent oxidoreductase [Actinomadura rubrisoli]|uniref:NAD(P)/FAD-dependent oxidoreductase n=1 Tax=Actinomadura rubrisoli TaxID=2530368 RepID=A0A4R5C5E5_9ACTN|nr:FAD-dependent oxidoreductase [Actinomadura rubrisoli]TDD93706.1 NAD(P)/FAD-dependent oxidoreductase [Actinomadura rubrisoli]